MSDKRKQWLAVIIIIMGIILLIGVDTGIDFIVDSIMNNVWHTTTNLYHAGSISDPGGLLEFFTLGVIFFPRGLRRYREARQEEAKIEWHQQKDLVLHLCICGLICGPLSILALWKRWAEFMLANNLNLSNPFLFSGETWRALSLVDLVITITFLTMVGWFVYLVMRQKRQQEISKGEEPLRPLT